MQLMTRLFKLGSGPSIGPIGLGNVIVVGWAKRIVNLTLKEAPACTCYRDLAEEANSSPCANGASPSSDVARLRPSHEQHDGNDGGCRRHNDQQRRAKSGLDLSMGAFIAPAEDHLDEQADSPTMAKPTTD
jgi:hypothetical protein